MPRLKGTRVIPGLLFIREKAGVRYYQTQVDRLPFSGVFAADGDEAAIVVHEEYVRVQKALKGHGDLSVAALCESYCESETRHGTLDSYFDILGGPGPKAASFLAAFGARDITTITLGELIPFIRNAKNLDGRPYSEGRRKKLRGAINKLYQEARKQLTEAHKKDPSLEDPNTFIRNLAQDEAVKDAALKGPLNVRGKASDKSKAASGPARRMTKGQVRAKRLGDEKAGSFLELRTVFVGAHARLWELYAMLVIQYVMSMRVGEVCALTKEDVDLDEMTLQICGQATAVKGRGVIVQALKEHRTASDEEPKAVLKLIPSRLKPIFAAALDGSEVSGYRRSTWMASEYLFPGTKVSNPRDPAGVIGNTTGLLKAVGVYDKARELAGTHWLKHSRITHGSVVNEFAHEDPEFIKQLGRHSSIDMAGEYIHDTPAMMIREARQSDELLAIVLGHPDVQEVPMDMKMPFSNPKLYLPESAMPYCE